VPGRPCAGVEWACRKNEGSLDRVAKRTRFPPIGWPDAREWIARGRIGAGIAAANGQGPRPAEQFKEQKRISVCGFRASLFEAVPEE
jgi:hypothetical protein